MCTVFPVSSVDSNDNLYHWAAGIHSCNLIIQAFQEGFHSTQHQVLSLHWAFEAAAERREQIYCCYLDFAHAFKSDDHEALWFWLRELNIPEIDLLLPCMHRHIMKRISPTGARHRFNTSVDRSRLISCSQCTPLLFWLVFNAYLLDLKATNESH